MLSRKFTICLGPIVVLLLLMAITVIVLLQGVLREIGLVKPEDIAVLAGKLRNVVLVLSLAFVILINVSVLVLFRMAGMILQPVGALVEGTRQLAQEHFDYRINIHQKDEFGLLADAYNELAEKLQSNEKRKIEMLHQAAVTLNHELNNAGAIINLQLQLLSRQSDHSATQEKYLQEIRHSLTRMTDTVQAMKNVRRIVLTEYTPGTKMLDLDRSQQTEEPVLTDANHPNAAAIPT